jgi:hypothetical protein
VRRRTCDPLIRTLLGVEAAETGESDARERGRECCARDGTVGVAQYVIMSLYRVQQGGVNAADEQHPDLFIGCCG